MVEKLDWQVYGNDGGRRLWLWVLNWLEG